MSEIEKLEATLHGSVAKLPKESARTLVEECVLANGNRLPEREIPRLREQTGWSRAGLFRIASDIDLPGPDIPDDATFLSRIAIQGTSEFVFDDLALGMLAAHGGNMSAFRRDVLEYAKATGETLAMPSESQLSRRFNREVRLQIREGVRTGHKRRYASTLRARWEAEYVNQICQLDEFVLNLACLTFAGDRESDFVDDNGDPLEPTRVVVGHDERWMVPVRARLLMLEDARSRFAWWAALDRPPTANDTLALLADKIDVRPAENGARESFVGGTFDVLSTDNAQCFRAHVVHSAMELAGGGSLDINVGYDPVGKGKVERLGQTIENRVVHGLQGHLSRMETRSGKDMLAVPTNLLLPFEQVVRVIGQVIYSYNYETVHSSLGMTPFEAFRDGCPNPEPAGPAVLADMMLTAPRDNGMRKVLNDGIQVFGRRGYLAPELARADVHHDKVRVQIRTFHHRTDKVAVLKPLERRSDPDAVEFVAMAEDHSQLPKAKRNELMRIWQVDGASVNRLAKTAQMLKEIANDSDPSAPVNLTGAAVADQRRTADTGEGGADTPEENQHATDARDRPTDSTVSEGERNDQTTPPQAGAQKVDSGRRPSTTRRPKPVPQEQRSPASGPNTSDLDMLEAAIEQSLAATEPDDGEEEDGK